MQHQPSIMTGTRPFDTASQFYPQQQCLDMQKVGEFYTAVDCNIIISIEPEKETLVEETKSDDADHQHQGGEILLL
eukprot:scaffold1763_cov181-Amphora_coffeaeformis.AAC.9